MKYIVVYKKKEESFDSLSTVRFYLEYILKDYGEHNTTIYILENNFKREISIEDVLY